MEQVIDGRKLYKWIKAEINPYGKPFEGTVFEFGNKVMDKIEAMENQPQADKWIPCEVELPPKPRFSEDSYLVKTKCVTTPYTAYWNGEKWTDVLDDDIEDVIAWCPIPTYPQPYKKEGAE